jgi:hypothetical protein
MQIAQIQSNIDIITGRPDRVSERNLAIQEATLALHGIENWWRDEVEQQVIFSANSNYQQIPLASLPRFRNFKYIRKFDPTGVDSLTNTPSGVPGALFDPCPPDKILDAYKLTKDNIYYLTGGGSVASAVCQLRSTVAFQYLLCSWMSFPIVDPIESYYSWIAELYPYAIITQAAIKLKKYIVDIDSVKALQEDAQMHLAALLASNLEFSSR